MKNILTKLFWMLSIPTIAALILTFVVIINYLFTFAISDILSVEVKTLLNSPLVIWYMINGGFSIVSIIFISIKIIEDKLN